MRSYNRHRRGGGRGGRAAGRPERFLPWIAVERTSRHSSSSNSSSSNSKDIPISPNAPPRGIVAALTEAVCPSA